MSGIRIEGSASNTTINGVRCRLVFEQAKLMLAHGAGWLDKPGDPPEFRDLPISTDPRCTPEEHRIACLAKRLLVGMRRDGYLPDATSKAVMRKIVDEAQRVKPAEPETCGG